MQDNNRNRTQFPLFQTPLDLAHTYWKALLRPDDCVIDATCGNGYDTLELAQLVPQGRVIALDNQQAAIETAQRRIHDHLPTELHGNVTFFQQCHSVFPLEIPKHSIALIVYNLGYLPGGNKQMTTMRSTTLQSLKEALQLIQQGGVISVMCYPGHNEGQIEEEEVVEFTKTLDPQTWSCCFHRWTNRNKGPSLLLVQSATSQPLRGGTISRNAS
ncbi:MAG: class I SAM-dependent methyltransferase [Parachlamydiaceae bacterium]